MGTAENQAAAMPVDAFRVWLRFIRMDRRLHAAMGPRLRTIGLSIPQLDLLSTLSEHEGLSQQEIAGRLYVTKGNVSGLVDRLVAGGLVERRASHGDRRSHALHLTAGGLVLVERGLDMQRAYVAETLGRLGRRDLADLERVLMAWRDVLRQQDPGRPR